MSCLTLLKLLDVCRWIFFLYCFWQLTHVVSKVEKLHTKYLLTKRMNLFLLLCSFLALFCFVSLYSCFLFVQFSFIV